MAHPPLHAGIAALRQAGDLGTRHAIDATAEAYRALHLFESVPTRRGAAAAHLLIGQLALFTTDLAEARDHLIKARDLFAATGIAEGESDARLLLGDVAIRYGDHCTARAELTAARDLLATLKNSRGVADAERRLGSLERRSGRANAALAHYARAAALFGSLNERRGLAGVHLSLGNLHAATGDDASARSAYRRSRELFEAVGDRLGLANAERFDAAAAARLGEPEQARDLYTSALDGYTRVNDVLGESYARQALGELALQSGDVGWGREQLSQAVELFARTCDPLPLLAAVSRLASSYDACGDDLGALRTRAWGVAEARVAARWAVDERRRDEAAARIGSLAESALRAAVELGEGLLAGAVIEGGVAGLVGILPLLLDAPTPGDEKTERLRRQVRALAARLAGPVPEAEVGDAEPPATPDATPTSAEPPHDQDGGDHPTSQVRATAAAGSRTEVITELEALLGARAREYLAPVRVDYADSIAAARAGQFVLQYACPGPVAEGQALYVVWSGPHHEPTVTAVRLTAPVADRLLALSGANLTATQPDSSRAALAGSPDKAGDRDPAANHADVKPVPETCASGPAAGQADADSLPAGLTQARGLGLGGAAGDDPAAIENARLVARHTYALWSLIDRDPKSDPVVAEVADALFPADFASALRSAADLLPPRVLIVPGPHLWNLPWPGLVVSSSDRLVTLARVSLAPSVASLAPAVAGQTRRSRSAIAWIPPTGAVSVKGTTVERATIAAVYGPSALAARPHDFLTRLTSADVAVASVHGYAAVGLAHGVLLAPGVAWTAADLIALDLPPTLIIGACWSSRVDPSTEPFALPLIAHARGAADIIGGVYPLPDAAPFPTARLLAQLYPSLLGTDPATALWLAQHEAASSGAAAHTWAGIIHSTVRLPSPPVSPEHTAGSTS